MRLEPFALTLAAVIAAAHAVDARGARGGGMRSAGARTSVTRSPGSYNRSTSRGVSRSSPAGSVNRSTSSNVSVNRDASGNVSRDVNRSVSRDVHRDTNVYGDRGYYAGGRYYGGAPLARAAVAGAAVGVTAAAIGSVAYSLPSGCGSFTTAGYPYYSCDGVYYAPQYSGDDVSYVVVEAPEGAQPAEQTPPPAPSAG